MRRAEEERIAKSFEPMRELVASVHLHDNHGDKDEHLAPYAGNIDWPAAVKLLKTAPDGEKLPIMLELKEKTGPGFSRRAGVAGIRARRHG